MLYDDVIIFCLFYLFYRFEFWFLCVIPAVLELRNLLVSAS